MAIYGTSRPRAKCGNENAMALLVQLRDSWPFKARLGHLEFTKIQKLLESKKKNKNENEEQNENKSKNLFWF